MEPATNEEPSSNNKLEEEPLKTQENSTGSSDNTEIETMQTAGQRAVKTFREKAEKNTLR